jgi:hypothetical protein
MVLKLETYVEVQTSEPVVVKQALTDKLNNALRELLNFNRRNGYLMWVDHNDAGNNPNLKRKLESTEQFTGLLNFDLKGVILTPDQVIERMRK